MTTAVLVFHPNLTASKANRALAEATQQAAAEGADIIVRDEYAAYSDGRVDVSAEQELLENADRIVLQFPVWWYSAPPLLKSWLDEVLAFGWAYGPGGEALRGKEIAVAVTAGGGHDEYELDGPHKCTMEDVLTPYRATAEYVGARWGRHFAVYGVDENVTTAMIEAAAREYRDYLAG